MNGAAFSRAGGLAAALAQTAAGVAAHAAAAGCLPAAGTLALTGLSAVVAVLLLGRVLRHRPVLRLAGGQLTVHALLAASACAGSAHSHAPSATPHLVMTAAHVAALVACRASLDAVAAAAERAVACLVALLRPVVTPPALRLPQPLPPLVVRRTAARRCTDVHRRTPRRGPPQPLPA